MAKSPDLFSPILAQGDALVPALRSDARDQDEQDVLSVVLDEIRRFCPKRVDGAAIDQRGKLGDELLGEVAERGWFGLTIPEPYGGAGLSIKAACRVVTELTAFNGSLGTCVGLHSGLALYSLIHLASEDLRARYLPEVALGQRIAAFAATEPGAGSDIAAMQATLREENGELRLTGSKCYVTNGGIAGLLTTVARSPGMGGARAGYALVVIDPAWPGIVRQAEEKKLGLKGSSTISIDYEGVLVPRDHVVGDLSLGLEYAHRALTWGRTFMAAGCLGSARAAVAQTEEHVRTRVQFGRPLVRFALVRHQLAGAVADVYATESMIRLVCHGFDQNLFDIALPSAAAKVLASERAWAVVDSCLQLLGGIGYIEDAHMARRLRDLRVTRIFEGANDVLRLHLASATLGWATSPLAGCPRLEAIVPPPVARLASRADRTLGEVLGAVAAVRKQHGFRLFERQVLQTHLADALIEALGAVACVLRAARSSPDSVELATAELAVERCTRRAARALSGIEQAGDERRQGLADRITGE
jgi:alkylation response protein AidB-like acyl-CoA dehydrogenase